MDYAMINEFITTVGFPITCVLGLGYFIWKVYNSMAEQNKDREARYIEMLTDQTRINGEFQQTLAELALTINAINVRLESIEDTIKE